MGKRSTLVIGSSKIIKENKQSSSGLGNNNNEKQYSIGAQAIAIAKVSSIGCQVVEIEIK